MSSHLQAWEAKYLAVAAPIPDPAPVMSTILVLRSGYCAMYCTVLCTTVELYYVLCTVLYLRPGYEDKGVKGEAAIL